MIRQLEILRRRRQLATLVLVLTSGCSQGEPAPVVTPGDPAAAISAPQAMPPPVATTVTDACRALPTRLVTAQFPDADAVTQRRGGTGAFQCLYRWPRPGGGSSEVALNVTPERFADARQARTWLDEKLEELARGVPAALRRRQVNIFRSVYVPVPEFDSAAHWSATQNVLVWIHGTEVLWLGVNVSDAPAENREHAMVLAKRLASPALDPAAEPE